MTIIPGIIFFRTRNLNEIVQFYTERSGMIVWLEQRECTILNQGNLLLGFCEKEISETDGVIAFFFETREDVDRRYLELQDVATAKPEENRIYKIYHFHVTDPEGRRLEFQSFLHQVPPIEIEHFLQE